MSQSRERIITRAHPERIVPPPSSLEKALSALADEAEKVRLFVPVGHTAELDRVIAQAKVALHVAEQARLPFS